MSTPKKDTMDLYQKLRQYRGSIAEICLKSKRSRDWVSNVLKGKYVDPKVIKIATKVLTDRYEDEARIMAQLDSVVTTCDASKIRMATAV